ncbi:RluA family pseudouridine synthase [Buchnera aphidicola]|uniref:Pseudouridine synthase n=1 Tax=Buchnera aphidicola (Anoecia oenotherae) TaxID=1241833 RepID=A0A4D6XRG3_9GAMM|nr:RluA family pseudouridine synthase [Buchnera aphidicola]QCI19396.1 RluA family pseudouridine synthase [Buchnera aphidicola (Anoecia oenotherae)]
MEFKKLICKTIVIDQNMINRRIDNVIFNLYKNVPKSMIYRLIRTGKIRINIQKIKPFYKLKKGDIVHIPPINTINKVEKKIILCKTIKKTIISSIMYEDEFLLIINKPAGIAVHGGSGVKFGIIEIFRHIRPKNKYLELVHRLDRETSGTLIIAKKYSSLKKLHEQWINNKIKKKYISIVHGHWPKNQISITQPLLKTFQSNKKRMVVISDKGKFAKTFFLVKKYNTSTTSIEVTPVTGRTHQIRVHSSFLGFPIIFDKRYGNTKLDKILLKKNKNVSLFLHASSIQFKHPENKKDFFISAPLSKTWIDYEKSL